MAYRFKSNESIAENVRRVIKEEVADAGEELGRTGVQHRDEAIHEARKSLKKLRGLLKLLRPILDSRYRQENAALRDIGRNLSQLRDAGAIIQTFDDLMKEEAEVWKPKAIEMIRIGLQKQKADGEASLNVPHLMHAAGHALVEFGERAKHWSIHQDGFGALAPGLAATYRDGRKAMDKALRTSDPDLYHAWRKRAKDHWYHVRLLSGMWAGTDQCREDGLHELETALGEDHNLAVLCTRLLADPDQFGGQTTVDSFQATAKSKQKKLRQRSRELGVRLYERKPKELLRDFERIWDVWQQEPEENTVAAT